MEKRCYTTAEAQTYLGIKRRAFQTFIAPRCASVKIGTSLVFEKNELDEAWQQYKIWIGSTRPEVRKGEILWDAAKLPGSMQMIPGMRSTNAIKANAFDKLASQVLKKQKAG